MQDEPRILVAAALGKIIEPLIRQSFSDSLVRIAEDQAAVEQALHDRLRFDEALEQPEVVGVYRKAMGPRPLMEAIDIAVGGGTPVFPPEGSPPSIPRIHAYFDDAAAKIVDYLGPLIRDRGEHNPELKMTPEVVYRWCGEHARYILSWCRRNGYADIATRVTTAAPVQARPS